MSGRFYRARLLYRRKPYPGRGRLCLNHSGAALQEMHSENAFEA